MGFHPNPADSSSVQTEEHASLIGGWVEHDINLSEDAANSIGREHDRGLRAFYLSAELVDMDTREYK